MDTKYLHLSDSQQQVVGGPQSDRTKVILSSWKILIWSIIIISILSLAEYSEIYQTNLKLEIIFY